MICLRSPKEIEMMRQAGLLVRKAHELVAPMVRPGTTTEEIDAAVERFLRDHDAVPLYKGLEGRVPFPGATCVSINEEAAYGIPGSRQLVEGDIVSIDIACRLNGWCADAAVAYPVGEVQPELKHLLGTARECLDLAIILMGKCQYWSEVAAEMDSHVKAQGFAVIEAFVGHGIGRRWSEDPQVPNFVSDRLSRSGDFRLVPGLVLMILPMINAGTKRVRPLANDWTQITADRKPSAHYGHTVAMTDSGPSVLTAGPDEYGGKGTRGAIDSEVSTSQEFLERLRNGTESAAYDLDARYREKLCQLVARELGIRFRRREDPEDVVQSALRSFFRRNTKGEFSFDHTGALWRLLATITRHKLLKHVEREMAKKRIPPDKEVHLDPFDVHGREPTPLEAAIFVDLMEQVMAGLKPPEVDVLQRRLEGHTQEEIARELGCTRAAVRFRLDRIRKRLEALLGEASGNDA